MCHGHVFKILRPFTTSYHAGRKGKAVNDRVLFEHFTDQKVLLHTAIAAKAFGESLQPLLKHTPIEHIYV